MKEGINMNWFKKLLCPSSLCKLALAAILGISCLTTTVSAASTEQNHTNFYNHHSANMHDGGWEPYDMPMMRGYWTADNAMTGNWQVEYPISPESINIFKESLKDIHNGYMYKPIAVSKQVINGMNYIYIAIANPAISNNKSGEQIVKIHIIATPAGAAPKVMRIMPVTP